jgi:hypothetical protein
MGDLEATVSINQRKLQGYLRAPRMRPPCTEHRLPLQMPRHQHRLSRLRTKGRSYNIGEQYLEVLFSYHGLSHSDTFTQLPPPPAPPAPPQQRPRQPPLRPRRPSEEALRLRSEEALRLRSEEALRVRPKEAAVTPPTIRPSATQWQCSDLVVRCKDNVYQVDRVIMCYHSKWFARICAIMKTPVSLVHTCLDYNMTNV